MQYFRIAVIYSIIAACGWALASDLVVAQEANNAWSSRPISRDPQLANTRVQPQTVQNGARQDVGYVVPPANASEVTQANFEQPIAQQRNQIPAHQVTAASATTSAPQVERSIGQQPPTRIADLQAVQNPPAARVPLPKATSGEKKTKMSSGWGSLVSAASGLLLVIAVFVGLALLTRRAWQPSGSTIPKQVFEVLGRTSYAPRQQVLVIRFGNKLLLVNHELGNVQTLSEIDAPEEVERIIGICEQNSSTSLTANFSNVLSQVMNGNADRRQNKRSFFARSNPPAIARRPV